MLRCTVAGLLPVMMSGKYSSSREEIFQNSRNHFENIIKSESWYILRYLPVSIAKKLAAPSIGKMLKKQRKTGLWKVKDAERITYDIYAALKHMDMLAEALDGSLIKYDTLSSIKDKYDCYCLLMKKNIFGALTEKDREKITSAAEEILGMQLDNGSWGNTVIETSVRLENLIELGISKEDKAVLHGCDFLFSSLNREFAGHHVGSPYGFTAEYMFSVNDRGKEFDSAQSIKPEWIPRAVCFRHIGIIQNSFALIMLMKLGFKNNNSVVLAVDNLFNIYSKYNGFCSSDIKKKYVAENGIRL